MKELFIVYIGGPSSMQVFTDWVRKDAQEVPMMSMGRYMRSSVVRLLCPERLVAVYAFCDACRSVRLEVFQVAAILTTIIEQCGDVTVAMERMVKNQNAQQFAIPESEAGQYSVELMKTVARLEQASLLVQRRKMKDFMSEAVK